MVQIIFSLVFSLTVFALGSPFESTVEGLSIGNAHQLDHKGKIFRGMEPQEKINELKDLGITDVLIFKTQTKAEVDQELFELKKLKIKSHHIPFRWKAYPSMTEACEQIVMGLKLLKRVSESSNRKIFFHCTVGEDRTGTLAGLWRMINEGWSKNRAFYREMCPRGFANGNPHKPLHVVQAIHAELTPLFLAMAQKIENGEISLDHLSVSACEEIMIKSTKLKCPH